jgi:Fe-S-cluster containining protein
MGVYLYLSDIVRIAGRLGLTKEAFARQFCFSRQTRRGAEAVPRIQVRKREDGACVFLEKGLCGIYRVRPVLCRLGPFVRGFMESPAYFRLFRATCAGIGTGRLRTREEIRRCLRRESHLEKQYQNDLAGDTFLNTILSEASSVSI